MNQLIETLFETYGESVLSEIGCSFHEQKLQAWIQSCLTKESPDFQLTDGLFDYYYRWASASFAVGLRLGLSLREDICLSGLDRV